MVWKKNVFKILFYAIKLYLFFKRDENAVLSYKRAINDNSYFDVETENNDTKAKLMRYKL